MIGGEGLGIEAAAEGGEVGIEGGEESRIGQPAPFRIKHGLMAGRTDASGDPIGSCFAAQNRGDPIAKFHPGMRGLEDGGVFLFAVPDFAPEPFGGINAPAFCQIMRAEPRCFSGDGFGFCVGGMIFPKPRHGGQPVLEFWGKGEGGSRCINGQGGAAGGIHADSDHGLRVECGIVVAGLFKCGADRLFGGLEVIGGVLAGEVGIFGVEQDAGIAAGVGENGVGNFCSVGEVHKKTAAGVGAVVETQGISFVGSGHGQSSKGGVGSEIQRKGFSVG